MYFRIKRRRWLDKSTGKIYSCGRNLVASGIRITAEFGAFSKKYLDTHSVSIKSIADFTRLKANVLKDYYKNHLSGFHSWNQKKYLEEFTLYACNLGDHLAIDESSLSNGELYTIVTNTDVHGRKGTLVAMVKGVKSDFIIKKLQRLPAGKRAMAKSVTMDMSNSMYKIVCKCFPMQSRSLTGSMCRS